MKGLKFQALEGLKFQAKRLEQKCNGLIILVEGMKTSKLYFCLNAKTEIRMFNANGTKTILIAPLSCKLGPNDYQTTLDK